MDRYSRHIALDEIGMAGQEKLSRARVLVIGAGGLACPVLQYLTAAGLGTIGIVDSDVVEISNLQRQVLFGESSLGRNKAIAAKQRLGDLNSEITIEAYPLHFDVNNALGMISSYDVLIDCSDNFETRYLASDASLLAHKPLVFGAIHKFEGQVSVFNHNDGPSYRCLFPEVPHAEDIPNCQETGVLGVLPGIVGSVQANEVLKLILEIGESLSGKLWSLNALNSTTDIYSIRRNQVEIDQVLKSGLKAEYQLPNNCLSNGMEISISNLPDLKKFLLVDVREQDERPVLSHSSVKKIPLSELKDSIHQLDPSSTWVFFCQQGMRSKQALAICREMHLSNCYSLSQGARALDDYLKQDFYEKQNT